MSPFQVDHIINESKKYNHANGKESRIVLDQPLGGEGESNLLLDWNKQKYDWTDDSQSLRSKRVKMKDD